MPTAYAGFAAAMKLPRETDDERATRDRGPAGGRPARVRGPARLCRGVRRAGRRRRGAGRPEQRQRLERPQRRGAPRRGGGPRRRGQRPDQPAVGRRPGLRGRDDRPRRRRCSTRSSAWPPRPARSSVAASRASRSRRRRSTDRWLIRARGCSRARRSPTRSGPRSPRTSPPSRPRTAVRPASPSSSSAATRHRPSTSSRSCAAAPRSGSTPSSSSSRARRPRRRWPRPSATLNADPAVDGVIVQMPLPPTIRLRAVIDAIDPAKDIDGIHPLNAGLLRLGYDGFLPATAHAAVEILRRSGIEIAGRGRGRHRPLRRWSACRPPSCSSRRTRRSPSATRGHATSPATSRAPTSSSWPPAIPVWSPARCSSRARSSSTSGSTSSTGGSSATSTSRRRSRSPRRSRRSRAASGR